MNRDDLRCSFCGKHQKEVSKIIAGPAVYICNECVDLCVQIINEELSSSERLQEMHEETAASRTLQASIEQAPPVPRESRARCPQCRVPLAGSVRTEIVDVPDRAGEQGARVMFLYCGACGATIDDVILPGE